MPDPKPIELHLSEGNPNRLTKAEIKRRQETELKFGNHNFVITDLVEKDKVAKAKWCEIVDLYVFGKVEFVSTADTCLMERYCLAYSDFVCLTKELAKLKRRVTKKLEDLKTVSVLINQARKDIKNTSELMLKMDKELLLTPISKLKTIGVLGGKDTPKSPLEESGFGDVV